MAFFPDAFSSFASNPSSYHRHSSSSASSRRRRRRSRSESRPRSGSSKFFSLPNSSRGSLFGLGNSSRSSLFRLGGFFQRSYRQLRRLLRDLVRYAKRHPWKVFFLVVMPLLTGGALSALLARFGLHIPPFVERLVGIASHAATTADGIGLVSDAVRFAGQFRSVADHRQSDRSGGLLGDYF
ncbi:hypothetical protein L249_6938 [Ophiocordyceps polyrhachis-furcata BCC 54312]|uniref:Uncharacterized protein n=1 Tax=Ophiocordyceps polyrhachis-furcata BCC 54312 TaxID=1330021 RepID=A0A367LJU8_9HYPO|nr:hypothetical protein L249_6938 [Ophiocordyceps polyrhachis-furcata BCC 54312]